MDWITLYISGKPGFKQEAGRKLEQSKLKLMPGYIGNSASGSNYDMYWVEKQTSLRAFKLAVGAKAIWRYRIKFYLSLEEFIQSQEGESTDFTEGDKALIKEMRKSA